MDALQPLRDLPDVEGSFVLDARGGVVVSDLRALFRPDMLASAGRRLQSMLSVIDENFDVTDELVAVFDRYRLVVRRGPSHTLVVVCRAAVPRTSMRMATSLVLKDLEQQPGLPQPTPMGPPAYGSAPPAAVRPPPTSAPRAVAPPLPTPQVVRPSSPSARPSSPPKKKGGGIWGD